MSREGMRQTQLGRATSGERQGPRALVTLMPCQHVRHCHFGSTHVHTHPVPPAGQALPRPPTHVCLSPQVTAHTLPPSLPQTLPHRTGARGLRWHSARYTPAPESWGQGLVGTLKGCPLLRPSPQQAPPRWPPPQGLSPCAPSTQGLNWGHPSGGRVSQDSLEASAPAAQHPPLIAPNARLGQAAQE